MRIKIMREAIKAAYKTFDGRPAPRWVRWVDRMPDNQVVAIYNNLKQQEKV
jgi:hypothetical protein